jgi:hypothetical protein
MKGNIFIKGNLYVTDDMNHTLLKENGLVFHVKGDVIFLADSTKLEKDDVFIDGIFEKFNVRDIIAFSVLAK